MQRSKKVDEQLSALARHLARRRAAILKAWADAVDSDLELPTASSLPRVQFNDHIPDVLDSFERRLHAAPAIESAVAKEARDEDAAAHGLQRWQQGYHLREVTREWGHLQLCLVDELEHYSAKHPDLQPEAMRIARRALAALCSEGVSESTVQYFELQELEADGQVRDLEQLLEQLRELERLRGELWHEAAHDLRGNLGTVVNATAGLTLEGVPEAVRDRFLRLLQRSVSSQRAMLDDVMNLARLQAGREQREVQAFDAAVLLRELCAGLQCAAAERGLYLKTDGPAALAVVGDAVKTRRVAQNLVLNALEYTQSGGVTVSWGASRANDSERWMLTIQDTGPGFHAGAAAPMTAMLEEATEDSRQLEGDQASASGEPAGVGPAPVSTGRRDRRAVSRAQGEGIGLSIVKRLCELLDASLEAKSEPGQGSTFRVLFPRECERDDSGAAAPRLGDAQPPSGL